MSIELKDWEGPRGKGESRRGGKIKEDMKKETGWMRKRSKRMNEE